jgi:hypothetical protein
MGLEAPSVALGSGLGLEAPKAAVAVALEVELVVELVGLCGGQQDGGC